MDTLYELTAAECEAVAGGFDFNVGQGGGVGVHVSIFNRITGTGPGDVLHNGSVVRHEVHEVQASLAAAFGPHGDFVWEVPFTPP
jgi:hypothetical protein